MVDRCADCGRAWPCLPLRFPTGNKTRDGSGCAMCSGCGADRRAHYRERGD